LDEPDYIFAKPFARSKLDRKVVKILPLEMAKHLSLGMISK
jgi:hypothetical protein